MPKRERDEAVAELSSTIFAAMLEEILMDVVQESHKEIARSRAVCDVCHTRCGAVHVPGPSNANANGSRIPTPSGDLKNGESPSATGTNTPVNGKDGNVYFECLECKRQIASNRYAPHLAGCMGLGNRRGAARNASVKAKLGSEAGKAGSPRLASEAVDGYEDSPRPPPKGKGKSKAKKSDDASFNTNGKRTASPSVSPMKKSKKQKTAASPATRIKPDPEPSNNLLSVTSSAARIPSKLRASSTVSSLHREQRSSSPESGTRLSSPARSISTQASTVIRSPAISNATLKSKQANGKGRGAPLPPRMPSPPRPPPAVPVIRMHETDLFVDVDGHGDETGSSTDTDSD
ncbi:hypothetical protein BD310DRAFT_913472 [Dichomitus squalens]|uniref:SAGA-associated factor 11 n=1 Tax=Dichomitus squalens TaxID=114155 RepID=A0A4Q9QAZ7_9APHY|nr:hypothetical protein BD310DRAFT_913472 [Dichomitus squalens]